MSADDGRLGVTGRAVGAPVPVRPEPQSGGASRGAGNLAASLRLLRSEARLIAGRRRNQAGILALAAVPVIIALAVHATGPSGGGDRGAGFFAQITSNGIFVALAAMGVEAGLFLPLAVATLSGDAIAGEANIGTLRYLLTVPVERGRLLAVKYASLVLGALFGVLVVALTGVAIGGALFGLGPITLLSGTQVGLAAALGRLAVAVLHVGAGLAALAAIGLFISTLTEQPIGATVAVTIVSTTMWILDGISQLDWLHAWLLVHHWLAFADAFRDPIFWDEMRRGLAVDAGYIAVFLALAWVRFQRRDVTS
ncbi:MAG: ABC transporter permease [Candidatus Nanopelagicales bacterium]